MAIVLAFDGHEPKIDPSAWIADNAVIIGDVEIGPGVSVWFGAVLRGDVGPIRIGARSNIQDGTTVHCTGGLSSCIVGEEVTVGHNCVLHGCIIEDRCLIGMGSVLLDNAVIGEESVVGAGSLVTARKVFEPGSFLLGRPARRLRAATPEERKLGIDGAREYLRLVGIYRKGGASGAVGV